MADAAGISPKEYVDGVAGEIKSLWDLMNCSYDKFIRTTDPEHEAVVKKIFKKLYDQGDIYKSEYEGWYPLRKLLDRDPAERRLLPRLRTAGEKNQEEEPTSSG